MLTDRDVRVLVTVARLGAVTSSQLVEFLFDGSDQMARRRCRSMVEAGLLRVSKEEGWPGMVYWITRQALQLAVVKDELRVPLRAPSGPAGEALLHRFAVNDVVLRYEATGSIVLTEREVRAAEQGPVEVAERLSVEVSSWMGHQLLPIPDANGRPRWFTTPLDRTGKLLIPDAVVVSGKGLVAVEVEMAVKESSRLYLIMDGYARRRPFVQANYFCTEAVRTALLGSWSGPGGGWYDGVLQRRNLLPGRVPWERMDAAAKGRCPVQVFDLEPSEPTVAWRLDMRAAQGQGWLTRQEWKLLRAVWEADPGAVSGSSRRMPFVRWWLQRWPQLRAERARRGLDEYSGDPHPTAGYADGAPNAPAVVEEATRVDGIGGAEMTVDPITGEVIGQGADTPGKGDQQVAVQIAAADEEDTSPSPNPEPEEGQEEAPPAGEVADSPAVENDPGPGDDADESLSSAGSPQPWSDGLPVDDNGGVGTPGVGEPTWDGYAWNWSDGNRWFPNRDYYEAHKRAAEHDQH